MTDELIVSEPARAAAKYLYPYGRRTLTRQIGENAIQRACEAFAGEKEADATKYRELAEYFDNEIGNIINDIRHDDVLPTLDAVCERIESIFACAPSSVVPWPPSKKTAREIIAEKDAEIDRLRKAITDVKAVIEQSPELNPSNYTHDEACCLNNAVIEAWGIVEKALAGSEWE